MNESEQQKAWRDFVYVFARSLGLILLVKKLRFLRLKPEYKMRDDNFRQQQKDLL